MATERLVRPRAEVLEALKGQISAPLTTISNKPGKVGEEVSVRIVKDGPGMVGLCDFFDSREWAGILNHVLLSARYATHFSKKLSEAGFESNPKRVLNGMLVSHPGRRQWDEAGWYPEIVENAREKRSISNETLGMQLIQGNVPQDVFELVVALGHNVEGFAVDPSVYDSWDFKIAIYVDHRTAQKYEPLNIRMGEFLLGNFFKREDINSEIRIRVSEELKGLIERQKQSRLRGGWPVSLDEADRIAQELGASSDSVRLARRELMRLILQDADTEVALISVGIDPEIDEEKVPAPRWERYLRRLYVNDAEASIYKRFMEIQTPIELHFFAEGRIDPELTEKKDQEFSKTSWWGNYIRGLISQDKMPYRSRRDKPQGIQRAIEFFGKRT